VTYGKNVFSLQQPSLVSKIGKICFNAKKSLVGLALKTELENEEEFSGKKIRFQIFCFLFNTKMKFLFPQETMQFNCLT